MPLNHKVINAKANVKASGDRKCHNVLKKELPEDYCGLCTAPRLPMRTGAATCATMSSWPTITAAGMS